MMSLIPQILQDRFGVEITALTGNASEASAQVLAKEICSMLSTQKPNALASSRTIEQKPQAQWICRAPITIKMRLFCLPYAGGVSENVFGR